MNSSEDTSKLTKIQLASLFAISKRTVIRTMQVALIPTSPYLHSSHDVQLFAVARRLLDEGKTYRQVKQFFITRSNTKEINQK